MIVEMAKVRILGPVDELEPVLARLQRLGVLHLSAPVEEDALEEAEPTEAERRLHAALERALEDVAVTREILEKQSLTPANRARPEPITILQAVAVARRSRRRLERLVACRRTAREERELLTRYRALYGELAPEADALTGDERVLSAYLILLREGDRSTLRALSESLESLLGGEVMIESRTAIEGEMGVLIVVPSERAAEVEALLTESRLEQVPIPASLGGGSVLDAIRRLGTRLAELDREVEERELELRRFARREGSILSTVLGVLRDRLLRIEAGWLSARTDHAFVLEGWVPASLVTDLRAEVEGGTDPRVAVEPLSRQQWAGEPAPVVLRNPRIFRPFEVVLRLVPLPRYGTVDPTPFVAVFFPMWFGLVLGDMGYGLLLGLIALVLRLRSKPESVLRSVSEVAGACALFAIAFGVLYGELLGDLGHRWLGLEALVFQRDEALVPFFAAAVALGAVHLLLGLVLGVISAFHSEPRKAAGRGVTFVMMLLVIVALLTVLEILPDALFTPSVIALLVAFPVLVILEGLTGPLELLHTLGRALSYARVMALGTASVMLAVIANRMVGMLGSVLVGVIFALLFHLVNFAIGVFAPMIHVLRLHYVEFFGTFYSPGGTPYQPFTCWGVAPPRPR